MSRDRHPPPPTVYLFSATFQRSNLQAFNGLRPKSLPLTSLQMPLPQTLSFDSLTNARGVDPTLPILGIVHLLQRPDDHFFSAFFSKAYALFQVTHPVSPLLAALTKTAGCMPTIPILERVRPACSCRPLLRAPRVTFCSQGSIRGWQHSLF